MIRFVMIAQMCFFAWIGATLGSKEVEVADCQEQVKMLLSMSLDELSNVKVEL